MEAPPDGFNCEISETGWAMSKVSVFQQMVNNVEAHLRGNGLPFDEAADIIDRQTAGRLAEDGHLSFVEELPVPVRKRTALDYLKGGRAYLTIKALTLRGKPIHVDAATSAARAEVCLKCVRHGPPMEEGTRRDLREYTEERLRSSTSDPGPEAPAA